MSNISFRQGILSIQSTLTGPAPLQASSGSVTSVDLVVVPSNPISIAFAHYNSNYIAVENSTVLGAWGTGANGSINGPLVPNQTQYLFWDIDLSTGVLNRGWTSLTPVYTNVAPSNPSVGQMWFDTVNTVWWVYSQGGSGPAAWVNKVRCFAGTYTNTAILTPNPPGSQVPPPPGIVGNFSAGNIILGVNSAPLKNADGTFVTTASSLIVQETSGQNVSFDAVLSYGEASEPIPAFYLVSYQTSKMLGLARNNNYTSFVSGMVTQPLNAGQVGNVVINGIVRNDQWSWPAINAPLYCGLTGQITLTPPPIGVTQQVGVVYDTNAIQLSIGPAIRMRV